MKTHVSDTILNLMDPVQIRDTFTLGKYCNMSYCKLYKEGSIHEHIMKVENPVSLSLLTSKGKWSVPSLYLFVKVGCVGKRKLTHQTCFGHNIV